MARRELSTSSQLWILLCCAVVGVFLAAAPWFLGALSVCGLSGCSGGGFGRSIDPSGTRGWMLVTGLAFAAPFLLAALVLRARLMVIAAVALLVLGYPLAGLAVGARPDGCPLTAPCKNA